MRRRRSVDLVGGGMTTVTSNSFDVEGGAKEEAKIEREGGADTLTD